MDSLPFSLTAARIFANYSAEAYDHADITDAVTSTQVLIRGYGGNRLVAFRGSKEKQDWLTDGEAWAKQLANCRVHFGFWTAIASVHARILEALKAYPPGDLYITGHSLGGALAMLFAYRCLADWPLDIAGVYTFGQPRVGDAAFAKLYNCYLRHKTFRFVNEEDIVPRLPGVLLGYRHCGQEVFLPSTGGTKLNPSLWRKLLSDGLSFCTGGLTRPLTDHCIEHYIRRLNAL